MCLWTQWSCVILIPCVCITRGSVWQTWSALWASLKLLRKVPWTEVPTMVRPFPAFSWLVRESRRGCSTFCSASMLTKTRIWGLEKEQRKTDRVFYVKWTATSFTAEIVRVDLQFLVCGGPSSSLMRAKRAALRDIPRIPSPHSFSALWHSRLIVIYDKERLNSI